jgi:hypothetical protein
MNVVLQGILSSFRTMADNTVKLTMHSQEIPKETAAELFDMTNTHVKFHVSNENINEEQIKVLNETELDKDELVNGKTKAQRIRGIMFLAWEKQGRPEDNFDQFYKLEMERIISLLKDVYL